jgi:hypothetical protein
MTFEKKKIVHSWNLNVLNMDFIFICVKLWTCKFCNEWEIFQKKLSQSKLLCFSCDLSNIQKCSLKECPFTWVALLIVFLSNDNWLILPPLKIKKSTR